MFLTEPHLSIKPVSRVLAKFSVNEAHSKSWWLPVPYTPANPNFSNLSSNFTRHTAEQAANQSQPVTMQSLHALLLIPVHA